MPCSYQHLDLADRKRLSDLHEKRVPVDEIAAQLGRHRSTIYRELKRNSFRDEEMPKLDGYYARVADGKAVER